VESVLAALRRGYTKFAIAALYALAMVMVGVAHQPASQHLTPVELAQYVLPDSTIPILCSEDPDHTDPGGTDQKSAGCDACRLISGPGIVGAPPVVSPARLAVPTGFSLAGYAYQPVIRASDNFLSRAPPSVV